MKKTSLFSFLLFSLLILLTVHKTPLYAVGGGGGGGGSLPTQTCTGDTWTCSIWSDCSIEGNQTRSCILSFDCPRADTSRPIEARACTPPCTEDVWSCDDWGPCGSEGVQTRACSVVNNCESVSTPSPQTARSCQPARVQEQETVLKTPTCTEDRWECIAWRDTCDTSGNQTRTCRLVEDCLGATNPSPVTLRRCPYTQCGGLDSRRERIVCRLRLEPEGLSREYEIEYLPEECRINTDEDIRSRCIARYRSFEPCWEERSGAPRFACARRVLTIGDISSELAQCQNEVSCRENLRERVYALINFRFYDLEERAEELIERGVTVDTVTDLIDAVTENKLRFNNASTKKERRQIILDMRADWKAFVNQAKKEISS